jgi:hypothetical protein
LLKTPLNKLSDVVDTAKSVKKYQNVVYNLKP